MRTTRSKFFSAACVFSCSIIWVQVSVLFWVLVLNRKHWYIKLDKYLSLLGYNGILTGEVTYVSSEFSIFIFYI